MRPTTSFDFVIRILLFKGSSIELYEAAFHPALHIPYWSMDIYKHLEYILKISIYLQSRNFHTPTLQLDITTGFTRVSNNFIAISGGRDTDLICFNRASIALHLF